MVPKLGSRVMVVDDNGHAWGAIVGSVSGGGTVVSGTMFMGSSSSGFDEFTEDQEETDTIGTWHWPTFPIEPSAE